MVMQSITCTPNGKGALNWTILYTIVQLQKEFIIVRLMGELIFPTDPGDILPETLAGSEAECVCNTPPMASRPRFTA